METEINAGTVVFLVVVAAIIFWRVRAAKKAGTGIRGVFGMSKQSGTTKRQ